MAALPAVAPSIAPDEGRTLRRLAAVWIALATGIFVFTAAAGVFGSWAAAIPVGALAAAAVAAWLWSRTWLVPDPAAASHGLRIISALATAVALAELVRMSVFMV